jgi:hypothetical protein
MSELALGFTEPPVRWVPGALSSGAKWPGREADHLRPSSAEFKNDGAIPPFPHTSSWCSTSLSTGTILRFTFNIVVPSMPTSLYRSPTTYFATKILHESFNLAIHAIYSTPLVLFFYCLGHVYNILIIMKICFQKSNWMSPFHVNYSETNSHCCKGQINCSTFNFHCGIK